MKVDALKIREIARRLGVSERTVEEYLLDRLTMQADEAVLKPALNEASARFDVEDGYGRAVDKELG